MKVLYLFVIAALLVGCGPSAEQMTATAVLAQAQTETALPTLTATPLPTLTPTSTSTPTNTPPPTITPTSTPIPPTVVEYPAPDKNPPSGMPKNAASEYMTTTISGFNMSVPKDNDPWTMAYFLSFKFNKTLPETAFVQIYLENPETPGTAILIQQSAPFEESLTINSDPFTGFQCKHYWVEVHIFEDSTMGTELGTHFQWIYSNYNTAKIKDIVHMLSGRVC